MLTDDEIDRWCAGNNYAGTVPGARRFARAIEAAVCAERDQRIAELERQLEEARKQMEAQKDEWLSWEAKRKALEKEAESYRNQRHRMP